MTEVIHGLISGLIWSAILGSCLIAIAAVITTAVPARAKVRHTAAGTTHLRTHCRSRREPVWAAPGQSRATREFPEFARTAGV
jgi:hypothetical protein